MRVTRGVVAGLAVFLAAVPVKAVPEADLLARYRPPSVAAPPSAEEQRRLDLGRMLFFDPLLSGNKAQSCATCHNPGLSWAAGTALAIGDDSRPMALRAPTLIDIAGLPRLGWDGKFASIEAVTFAAVSGGRNMNLPVPTALARIQAIPGYAAAFAAAFPGQGVTRETAETAIAAYERTIVSGASPFDRWVAGDATAIGARARHGFVLFNGAARCAECHSGWAFTDGSFHDIGIATGAAIGRGAFFPTSLKLRYAFKTPTLRDVARRAPYMHDGSIPTLAAVVALYDHGGIDRPSRSELIRPLGLSPEDRTDLVAFLQTLTEDPVEVRVPVLPR